MKLTFRWYGEKDCIPLNYIKQIQGMTGVVTAVYDTPVGEVWELGKLLRLKELANNAGLGNFYVTEVSEKESWLITAEWMQTTGPDVFDWTQCVKYGSDNSLWLVKLFLE